MHGEWDEKNSPNHGTKLIDPGLAAPWLHLSPHSHIGHHRGDKDEGEERKGDEGTESRQI